MLKTRSYSPSYFPLLQHSVVPLPNTSANVPPHQEETHPKLKQAIVAVAPCLYLIGGLSLLLTALSKHFPKQLQAKFNQQAKATITKIGTYAASGAFFFGALNEVLSGVSAQQPSMVLSGVLVSIPIAMLLLAKNSAHRKAYAYNLWVLLAGLWTLGFANDIENKNARTWRQSKRTFDFTVFTKVLNTKTPIPFTDRVNTLFQETGRLIRFSVEDHLVTMQSLYQSTKEWFTSLSGPHRPLISSNPRRHRTTVWNHLSEPSAALSRISVILTYLGAVPYLLFGYHNPSKRLQVFSESFKRTALVLANLSVFNLALQRKDIKGRLPLIGVPLTLIGTPGAKNDLQIAISQLGEALNNWFFSDMALHQGLPRKQALDEVGSL